MYKETLQVNVNNAHSTPAGCPQKDVVKLYKNGHFCAWYFWFIDGSLSYTDILLIHFFVNGTSSFN